MDFKSSKYEVGLTKKSKVSPVAELIRKCEPSSLQEWEEYYLN